MKAYVDLLAGFALAGLLIVIACGSAESTSGAAGRSLLESPEEREQAADFTLEDAQGNKVQLSEYKGKAVLLNFWATWCGPCKIEMPWFVEFQRKYKDQGFTVIAVSLDEEGWEVVKPFAEDLNLNFPVVLGNDEVADRFGGIAALPTTLILDQEGRIAKRHTGLVSKSDYQDAIEQLL